jgi:hypothetical protein
VCPGDGENDDESVHVLVTERVALSGDESDAVEVRTSDCDAVFVTLAMEWVCGCVSERDTLILVAVAV